MIIEKRKRIQYYTVDRKTFRIKIYALIFFKKISLIKQLSWVSFNKAIVIVLHPEHKEQADLV
jgi:hypothetical protein